jgi:hypothetical protein
MLYCSQPAFVLSSSREYVPSMSPDNEPAMFENEIGALLLSLNHPFVSQKDQEFRFVGQDHPPPGGT